MVREADACMVPGRVGVGVFTNPMAHRLMSETN